MRVQFLCCLIYLIQPCFSQTDTSKRLSLLTLDTVRVSTKAKVIKKLHLGGFPSYNGLSQTSAVVSFVGDLPDGTLKSVSFYFNCGLANHLKHRLKIKYKDVELGLLVYKANSDSTLGEKISENDIRVIVPADHRGAFKVDIARLNISEKSVFIGFSVLSKLEQEENNIYVRYNESKKARSFVKMNFPHMTQTQGWRKPFGPDPTELKLSLEIEQ